MSKGLKGKDKWKEKDNPKGIRVLIIWHLSTELVTRYKLASSYDFSASC